MHQSKTMEQYVGDLCTTILIIKNPLNLKNHRFLNTPQKLYKHQTSKEELMSNKIENSETLKRNISRNKSTILKMQEVIQYDIEGLAQRSTE